MSPDYDNGQGDMSYQNDKNKIKITDHVRKEKKGGELAMAEWGKKNKLLTA
jgi:hypothetical protein